MGPAALTAAAKVLALVGGMLMMVDRVLRETRGGGRARAVGARGGGREASLGSSTRSMEWIAALICGRQGRGAGG